MCFSVARLTKRTLEFQGQIDARAVDLVLFPGDLSYADGFGPRWDSYGRLSEFLFSAVPAHYLPGNHEFERGENFAPFLARYAPPRARARTRAPGGLWHSFEAGPAHVVMLCAYCNVSAGSPQRALGGRLPVPSQRREGRPPRPRTWPACLEEERGAVLGRTARRSAEGPWFTFV